MPAERNGLPRASAAEAAGLLADVLAPTIAKGALIRRPRIVGMAERLNLDARALRRMRQLADRYGPGPVMIPNPVRPQALILDPAHVARVLDETPDPFSAASSEKRSALTHFQPSGVLVSEGETRAVRRAVNEAVLETPRPNHSLADRFATIAAEEAGRIRARERFGWAEFVDSWFRIVRRVVLGEGAADDRQLTDMLARLRGDANWGFAMPRRRRLRAAFAARLDAHLRRAEPGSLAERLAQVPSTNEAAPMGQVPQWLFAFDAAGIALVRTLALFSTHPAHAEQAVAEARAGSPTELHILRAGYLDAVRLWPTTPMILRQAKHATVWDAGVLPAGAGILLFAPFFHRDARRLAFAHSFAPEIWDGDGSPEESLGLVPFSAGPAGCPGRNLVLLLASATLAELIRGGVPRLARPERVRADRPLPLELSPFTLEFTRA